MEKNKFSLKKTLTLVEVMVVTIIFTIIFLSILAVITTWQRSWDISEAQMDAQFQARRTMRRITEELIQASPSNITINADNDIISFNLPSSYAAGSISWGDQIQYSLGGLDGQQLLRTNLDTGDTEVLGSYINAVQFIRNNDIVQIQVTVNKPYKGDNIQIQLASQVSLRNR
jgi:type II secretory pathway pseudopilin PulG|nr:type II secretion system protein [Candidatus Omnitrophota bacterium]